jgi:hypothetical protein
MIATRAISYRNIQVINILMSNSARLFEFSVPQQDINRIYSPYVLVRPVDRTWAAGETRQL